MYLTGSCDSVPHRGPGPTAGVYGDRPVDLVSLVRTLWDHAGMGLLLVHAGDEGEAVVVRANATAATLLDSSPELLEGRVWGVGLSDADRRRVWEGTQAVRCGRAEVWSGTLRTRPGGVAVGVTVTPLGGGRGSGGADLLLVELDNTGPGSPGTRGTGGESAAGEASYSLVGEELAAELRAAGADVWLVLDDTGRVVRLNAETARLAGLPAAELRGRFFWEALEDPALRARARAGFEAGPGGLGLARWQAVGGDLRTVL